MSVFLLVLGLVLFVGLVVLHEFGHFIMAKRGGVDVEEFGVGFPPKAMTLKKHKGTEYTLNWLPLGGFVRLKGENDADTRPHSFGAASLSTKVKIMTAGVVMNLLAAFVLLTMVAWAGMPQVIDNQFTVASDTKVIRQDVLVGYVEPDSPADSAGLRQRDKLISLNSNGQSDELEQSEDLKELTSSLAGQEVEVKYSRGGETKTVHLTLRSEEAVNESRQTDNPKGFLGVAPAEYKMQRSTWSAPVVAAGLLKQFTTETLKGLGKAVSSLFSGDTGAASQQVAGPVGIFFILRDSSLLGYQFVLFFIALISLTLAIMNILPIPALDGGRLFVTLLFRAVNKPLTKRAENLIHGTGFALLMLLFVLITVVDVNRFF